MPDRHWPVDAQLSVHDAYIRGLAMSTIAGFQPIPTGDQLTFTIGPGSCPSNTLWGTPDFLNYILQGRPVTVVNLLDLHTKLRQHEITIDPRLLSLLLEYLHTRVIMVSKRDCLFREMRCLTASVVWCSV